MAVTIKTLRAEYDAVMTKFNAGLRAGEKRFAKFRSNMKRMATRVAAAVKPVGIAIAALGTAIVGLATATTIAAASFEKDMSRVHSLITDLPTEKFDELREGIKKLSKESGRSLSSLADALYEVVSAGVEAGDAIDVLRVATKAAVAGGVTAKEAFDLLGTIIKGYGLEWSEAGRAFDVAFKIVEQGKTSIGALSAKMGEVIPLAAKLGVGLEQLGGAYATLTGVTGNTNLVTTQLRGILNSILNPTDEVADKWNAAELQAKGLVTMMQNLVKWTGGNIDEMKKYIPQIEALPAALALAGPQAEAFAAKTQAMADAAGATSAAHAVMADDLVEKWKRLKQTLLVIGVEIGEGFIDPVGKVVDKLKSWFDANEELIRQKADEAVKKLVGALEDLANWWDTGGEQIITDMGTVFGYLADSIARGARNLRTLKDLVVGIGGKVKGAGQWVDALIPSGMTQEEASGALGGPSGVRRGRPPIIQGIEAEAKNTAATNENTSAVAALRDAVKDLVRNTRFTTKPRAGSASEELKDMVRALVRGVDFTAKGGAGRELLTSDWRMGGAEFGGVGRVLETSAWRLHEAADKQMEAAERFAGAVEEFGDEGRRGRSIGYNWPAQTLSEFSIALMNRPRWRSSFGPVTPARRV